jgi:hypothetical protein
MPRNYRVLEKGGQYAIHEVVLAADGTITGFSKEPAVPCAASLEELKLEIDRYRQAVSGQVFDEEALAIVLGTAASRPAGERTAVGVFEDRRHARLAVDELCRNGFALAQIGFATPEERPVVDPPHVDHHTRAGEGAAAGAAAGGTLGGVVGIALATAILPGIGPVLAGGLLAGGVAGAVAGLASGSLLGALLGMSVPEEEARVYEQAFHSGQTVVTVQAGERYDEAMAILRHASAAPEQEIHIHPGRVHPSSDSDVSPGSGSVFVGE